MVYLWLNTLTVPANTVDYPVTQTNFPKLLFGPEIKIKKK